MDTFAEVSLIDSRIVNRVSTNEKIQKNIMKILGVNNKPLETLGVVQLEVVFEETKRNVNFAIVDRLHETVRVPVLLGVDSHRQFESMALKFTASMPEVRYGPGVVATVQQADWREGPDGWLRRRPDGAYEFRWRWKAEPKGLIWKGAYIYERKLKTDEAKQEFRREMESWINNKFLVPYDDATMGPPGAILPLNPVVQPGKSTKVRPTCDYTELNPFIVSGMDRDHNEVCSDSVRKWRAFAGFIVADLSKAYMRVHIVPELYRFQTIQWEGRRYALTRLGFGLSSAPRVLKTIIDGILEGHNVDAYRDDLCVGFETKEGLAEARAQMSSALKSLQQAGFPAKETTEVVAGEQTEPIRILGLEVYSDPRGTLRWRRKAPIERPESLKTLRELAGMVGKLAPGNLPVLAWARPYAQILRSVIGREAGTLWKDPPTPELCRFAREFVQLLTEDDPAGGIWSIAKKMEKGKLGSDWVLCCDASQIAMGSVLISGPQIDEDRIVEDHCWLNTKPRQINVLEAEAIVKGLTEACKYIGSGDRLKIVVDSKTAHSWAVKAINNEIFRCNSLSGPLLARRLSILHDLSKEIGSISVVWVPSSDNPADKLTRVNARWVEWFRTKTQFDWDETPKIIGAINTGGAMTDTIRDWQGKMNGTWHGTGTVELHGLICQPHRSRRGIYLPVIPPDFAAEYIRKRHEELGHQGTNGLWQSVREEAAFPGINLASEIAKMVGDCDICTRKHKSQYTGSGGTQGGRYPWDEVFVDCLTLPSASLAGVIVAIDGFSRWLEMKPTESFSSKNVIGFLDELASRFGYPKVIRVDHGREFDNAALRAWCEQHGTMLQFSSVANPRSQSTVERANRTILGVMRALAAEDNRPWEEIVTRTMSIYNGRSHSALNGATPREVFLGRREIHGGQQLQSEEQEPVREWESLYEPLAWEREYLDPWTPAFEVNQTVWACKQRPKDQFDYEPATVVSQGHNRAYRIETLGGRSRVVHESNLKARKRPSQEEEKTTRAILEDKINERLQMRAEDLHVGEEGSHLTEGDEKNFENGSEREGEIPRTETPAVRRSTRPHKPIKRFDA